MQQTWKHDLVNLLNDSKESFACLCEHSAESSFAGGSFETRHS
jgi:hypothetical protein